MRNFSHRNNPRKVNEIHCASKITYMRLCRMIPETFIISCRALQVLLLSGFEFLPGRADVLPVEQ